MGDLAFDELDVAIVDAVRTAPRGSWRLLADALDVDPATVGRRWARLEAAGVAWVTAHPSGAITPACAVVEVDCSPGRSTEAAHRLAEDGHAATVKIVSGARDLLVLAQAPTFEELARYLLGMEESTPGVSRIRSHVVTGSTIDASRWRDGALSPAQSHQLAESDDRGSRAPASVDATDRSILEALSEDGRMSFERLAQRVGLGAVAVRRRLDRMQASGSVTFRCDAAPALTGRRVSASYFGSLQIEGQADAEERIRTLPGVRTSSFVAGPHNIVIDVSLRSTSEVHDLEWRIGQELPTLRVEDRSVVLSMTKLLGRVLDTEGRSVRVVPLRPDEDRQR